MAEGWKCPVCGRGVAPSEKVCEHGASHGGLGVPIVPTFIPHDHPRPNQWRPYEGPNDVPSRTADWYRWRPPYEVTSGDVSYQGIGPNDYSLPRCFIFLHELGQNAGSA